MGEKNIQYCSFQGRARNVGALLKEFVMLPSQEFYIWAKVLEGVGGGILMLFSTIGGLQAI